MSYDYNYLRDFFIAFWAVIVVILVICSIIGIISYVFRSLGLYKIAQRRYYPNPWMAWIPYANTYLYAVLIDQDLVVGKKTVRNFPVWYLVYPFIIGMVSFVLQLIVIIPIIGWIIGGLGGLACSVASLVIRIYVLYRFYKKYRADQVTLFTVLSALVPLAETFILFYISRKPFVGEAVDGTPPPQPTLDSPTY